jgi:hypothetical protein
MSKNDGGISFGQYMFRFGCDPDSEEDRNILGDFSQTLTCGGCYRLTTLSSQHTCRTCGRMLCGKCGKYCLDHKAQEMTWEAAEQDKLESIFSLDVEEESEERRPENCVCSDQAFSVYGCMCKTRRMPG